MVNASAGPSPVVRPASASEVPRLLALIEGSGLPGQGVADHVREFLVAEAEGEILATGGLEIYGDAGLLRSLAVAPGWRDRGLGAQMVEALLARARARGVTRLYLLTTTAERFFPRFGFEVIDRAALDPRLAASEELRGACPRTAVAMRLELAS